MKLIVLALVFQFVISCWPKTNMNRVVYISTNLAKIIIKMVCNQLLISNLMLVNIHVIRKLFLLNNAF